MSDRNSGFDDLFSVGPGKPLGYLPISTIENRGKSADEIRMWAAGHGLGSRTLSPFECDIGSGAVYVWDDAALQSLLDANAEILIRANWPRVAEDFVIYVANQNTHEPALFELVGVAFNDWRFREKRKFVRVHGQQEAK